jgi:hypothetical protein
MLLIKIMSYTLFVKIIWEQLTVISDGVFIWLQRLERKGGRNIIL